jgi:2-polyprenyl-3-methyl-5-hydroxy-6-metoxy-1,4-benzoquinol methylase
MPISIDYSASFFNYIDDLQKTSYPIMALSILRHFSPRSVVDVGCGSGGLLHSLKEAGIRDCYGIEYSNAGRKKCKKRNIICEFGDLTHKIQINKEVDLAICIEVAEHLPAECAELLVETLVSGPGIVLFSAATPGQGGLDHINEQPHEYWINKFGKKNYVLDIEKTKELRKEWSQNDVVRWYALNIMVFREEA